MFGDAALVVLRLDLERNDLAAESWEPLGPLPLVSSPIPTIEANAHEARALLEGLLDRKVANPLDTIPDLGDVARAIELLRKNAELAASYNDDVRNANSAIEAIRVGAASSELTAAAERVEQLERQRSRYESPNKDECDAYQSLVSQKQGLEAAKVEARRQLDVFTADLLGKYQKSINDCLTLFDAGFRIVDATTSYEGGLPRLQYALELRSHRIAIGSREGSASRPRFGNTLSDSDRRALAFAFFTARLQVDGNLSRQTVVFDDPISSFDQFRRRTTADVLMDIAKSSQQIIVMSHDPLFIQALSEDRRAQTSVLPC
jgi:wobble nucleotide-excising tRNase